MANEVLAISLYAAYDRPTIEPQTVSLDQLVGLLTTFEVLADKYAGRCWSPARYVDDVRMLLTSRYGPLRCSGMAHLFGGCDVSPVPARRLGLGVGRLGRLSF